MKRVLLLTVVFLSCVIGLCPTGLLKAQTSSISGTVNRYSKVTGFECNKLQVENPGFFGTGDKVLLIQMQGASVSTALSENLFGSIINYNSAGNYEFHTVSLVNGNEVVLESPLERTYELSGNVQLVFVPTYNQALVVGQLTGAKWNGSTGGVIALECTGTLTLQAGISASGIGFRPGPANRDPGPYIFCNPDVLSNPLSTNKGGHKGEGIAAWQVPHSLNKGPWANGGGGGNDHNAGGGGGSNSGVGGRGGFADPVPQSTCPGNGLPGRELVTNDNRVFMGGAGGNGHDNDFASTQGGAGGGVIIIKAGSIVGNNQVIQANGETPPEAANDGSGGGGAGGSILLSATTCSNCNIQVKGGNGGDNNWGLSTQCVAPGGGGGGGLIRYNGNLQAPSISLSGGTAGKILNQGSTCFNTSFGATNGQAGKSENGLVLYEVMGVFDTTIIICEGQSYSLPNGQVVSAEGSYPVAIETQTGCDSLVNYILAFGFKLQINAFASPAIIQPGQEVLLSVTPEDTSRYSYQWSPPATLSAPDLPSTIAQPQEPTWYYITVKDKVSDCIGFDSVFIAIEAEAGCGLYIPNAFTPDGNGVNDCFRALGNILVERFSLAVYNRWGEKVFESKDPTACWDGKYKNQEAPMDAYVFYLSYKCPENRDFSTRGVLSLIR